MLYLLGNYCRKENNIDTLISVKCGYGDETKFHFNKIIKYIMKIKNNEIYLEYCEL